MLTFRSYGDRDTLVRPAIRACRQGRYRDGLFARDRPFYRFRTCSARRFGSGQPRRHIRIVRFRCSWSSFARSSKTLAPAVVAAGSVGEASGRQAILEVALALGRGENKGRIHILVHNAAVSGFAPLGALTEEHIDEVIGINLRGVMLLTSLVCAHMPEHAGGRVIFVSSVGSRYTPPPRFGYLFSYQVRDGESRTDMGDRREREGRQFQLRRHWQRRYGFVPAGSSRVTGKQDRRGGPCAASRDCGSHSIPCK